MLLTSFEYTWLKEFVGVGSTTSVLSAAGNTEDDGYKPTQEWFLNAAGEKIDPYVSGSHYVPFRFFDQISFAGL